MNEVLRDSTRSRFSGLCRKLSAMEASPKNVCILNFINILIIELMFHVMTGLFPLTHLDI